MARSHYELAFESFLSRGGTPFVAVESMKRVVPGSPALKLFDYVVYAEGKTNFLVEVKGRKVERRPGKRPGAWECWVTEGDIEGLSEWRSVFGAGFEPAFVFAYWLVGGEVDPNDGVALAGRAYLFRVISLADYVAHKQRRSPRWKTITLGTADFRRLARSPGTLWAPRK